MKSPLARTLAIPLLALALSSCSSAAQDGAVPEGAPLASDGGGASASDSDESASDVIPLNAWGMYESTTIKAEVHITDATCGVQTIAKGGGFDAEGNLLDASAPAGKKFCVVHYEVRNVGDAPAEPPYPFGYLTATDGKKYAPTLDEMLIGPNVYSAENDYAQDAWTATLNPGDMLPGTYVVSIPDGITGATVEYPNEERVLVTKMRPLVFSLAP